MWPDGFWQARHGEDLVGVLTAERTEDDESREIGLGLRKAQHTDGGVHDFVRMELQAR